MSHQRPKFLLVIREPRAVAKVTNHDDWDSINHTIRAVFEGSEYSDALSPRTAIKLITIYPWGGVGHTLMNKFTPRGPQRQSAIEWDREVML